VVQEEILDTENVIHLKDEWEQIDIFSIFQDATEVVEWISVETDATIPENTRIVYKFYPSDDGVNWL
jgi:hypothetical protein